MSHVRRSQRKCAHRRIGERPGGVEAVKCKDNLGVPLLGEALPAKLAAEPARRYTACAQHATRGCTTYELKTSVGVCSEHAGCSARLGTLPVRARVRARWRGKGGWGRGTCAPWVDAVAFWVCMTHPWVDAYGRSPLWVRWCTVSEVCWENLLSPAERQARIEIAGSSRSTAESRPPSPLPPPPRATTAPPGKGESAPNSNPT